MISADEVCRLCASQNGKMLSIYSEEGIVTKLEHKINSYLPIKVSEQDDLTLQCCCGCISILLAWHQLFVSCVEAEKRLRSFKIENESSLSPSGSYTPCLDNIDSDSDGDKLSKTVTSLQEENCGILDKKKHELNVKNPDFIVIPEEIPVIKNSYPCHNCKTILSSENDLNNHLKNHKTSLTRQSKRIKNHSKLNTSKTINEPEFSKESCENVIASKLDTDHNLNASKVNITSVCDDQSKSTKISPNEVSVIIDNKQHPNNLAVKISLDKNVSFEGTKEDKINFTDEQVGSHILEKNILREEIEDLIDSACKTCKICNLNFEKKVNLNQHLFLVHKVKAQKVRRKHSEIEAVAFCDVCDKGFTRRFDMIKHRKNKHHISEDNTGGSFKRADIIKKCTIDNGNGKQIYKCDICGHIFKQSYSLMRHHTIHTGDRPYFCELCGKDFRTASGLNRHVNEFHYSIKKFQCEVCSKQFKTRATKDEHMNIHTDTRPYVCDICGKAYRQKASLYVHKTYHTNNFRFSCSICGNKYRRAQELKVHNWSHTGHKPFKCQVCHVQFRLKHDLKKHSQTHMSCD